MIKVNILKNWLYPDLSRQTPGNNGIWDGIEFVQDSEQPSDYVIVLNYPKQDTVIECPKAHVWAIMQEPPTEINKFTHLGDPSYARIYTTDVNLKGDRYIQSQPVLPWHLDRSYDFLKSVDIPEKTSTISWVTSNRKVIKGHRDRMDFLDTIRKKLEFDLFGRGFAPLGDKWQGIAPYHYSIAIENYSNPFYWSEKISDCFLAWTMPIYYGCTHITEYFPAESMILIDIHRPDEAIERIEEAIVTKQWQKNVDAIRFARKQVLEHYQLFPFIADQIKKNVTSFSNQKTCSIFIPAQPRDTQQAQYKAQLAQRDAQLAQRDAQLAQRDAQLAQRDAQITAIYSSRTWKLSIKLRQIYLWFTPLGSLRSKMGTWLLMFFDKIIGK